MKITSKEFKFDKLQSTYKNINNCETTKFEQFINKIRDDIDNSKRKSVVVSNEKLDMNPNLNNLINRVKTFKNYAHSYYGFSETPRLPALNSLTIS